MDYAKEFIEFVEKSPSPFHAVENLSKWLETAGYLKLEETKSWNIQLGGKYFVTRNGSSILSFRVPREIPDGFMVASAHSDSPTFKIKENPEKVVAQLMQLSTEKYGGMLMAPWFDRPLSIAGRVTVKDGDKLDVRLVSCEKDLLIIPSVAIHMNHEANKGMEYKAHVDTLPLYGEGADRGTFKKMVAEMADVPETDILGGDLFLYLREKGTLLGVKEQFIGCPKLDDLECAWSLFKGFVDSELPHNEKGKSSIPVCAVFDNEEVGSSTKQGAGSNFLRDTLRRIVLSLGMTEDDYLRLVATSFMVSADNAHAEHPNHPEYSDSNNCPQLNQGVVIKYNANQNYATDGISAGLFRIICEEAGVPVQVYSNRSDLGGGSTLGSIATTKVSMPTVDIGLAQLAMHSPYETGGGKDIDYLIKAMTKFFEKAVNVEQGVYELV